ncbi:MAG: nucleotidyltransferase family protein [Candidatus Planktophila sp.]|nr:nucleotidyltransferase family protein [Candidatus Planktophila sp.]
MIAGLILAAGEGRRMGRPKATLEIDGVRLVDRAVAVFKAAGVEKIFVVLGAWVGQVDGATVIENKDWASGMASSLRAGLSHINDVAEIESVVISLVDLPAITSEAVKVIAGTPRDLVVATYNDVAGHPVKFARSHWSAILAAVHGDSGARDYLRTRPDTHYLRLDDLAQGFDLDSPADLQKFLNSE